MIETEQRPPDVLLGLFARARRRLRTIWVAATSSAYAPWVCLAAVAVAAIGWVRPWAWPEIVAIGVVLTAVVLLIIGALILSLPDPAVARAIDRGLDTDDAIVTALQFSPDTPFGPRIHAQAVRFADADLAEALPVPWRPRPLAVAAVLLGCLIALIAVSNPQDSVRQQLAAEREQIDALAEEFDDQAEELLDAEEATAETDELAAELAALAEALRNADGLEDAISELDQTQDDLLRSLDANDLAERAATQGLERTLDANPLSTGESPSDQLAALSASLAELDASQLAAIAERLEQLAATQEAGDPETAAALAEAAEALAAGDLATAQAALEAAGLSTAEAAASGQATGEVQAAAAAAGQAADALENGEGQGQGEGQGEGQGNGQGEGQGEGQGGGEGAGEGQGQGEGQGNGQGMNATGNNPSGQGGAAEVDGSGNQGEGIVAPPPDTPVLIPTDGESDTSSADVDVTGDGQTSTDQRIAGVTGSGVAQVPLESISNDFADRASEALDGTNISSSEAQNVANYFDALTQE